MTCFWHIPWTGVSKVVLHIRKVIMDLSNKSSKTVTLTLILKDFYYCRCYANWCISKYSNRRMWIFQKCWPNVTMNLLQMPILFTMVLGHSAHFIQQFLLYVSFVRSVTLKTMPRILVYLFSNGAAFQILFQPHQLHYKWVFCMKTYLRISGLIILCVHTAWVDIFPANL